MRLYNQLSVKVKGQKYILIESKIGLLFVLLFEMLPFLTALRHFLSSARTSQRHFPRFLLVACYCFEWLLGPGAGIYKEMSGVGAVLSPLIHIRHFLIKISLS